MADSTVTLSPADVAKLKVVELKRELKNRGLSATGDKAELSARLLQAIVPQPPSTASAASDTLDSDEIDSDAVLQDDIDDEEDDDDQIIGNVTADHDLSDSVTLPVSASAPILDGVTNQPSQLSNADNKPNKSLKREATVSSSEDTADPVPEKKISLNRTAVVAPVTPAEELPKAEGGSKMITKAARKIIDPDSVLEMRAQRFGIPLTGDKAKEARKARFGGSSSDEGEKEKPKSVTDEAKEARKARFGSTVAGEEAKEARKERFGANAPSADIEVLKKRAERFGLNVSKTMVDIEQKEKLEKRKLKFGLT